MVAQFIKFYSFGETKVYVTRNHSVGCLSPIYVNNICPVAMPPAVSTREGGMRVGVGPEMHNFVQCD